MLFPLLLFYFRNPDHIFPSISNFFPKCYPLSCFYPLPLPLAIIQFFLFSCDHLLIFSSFIFFYIQTFCSINFPFFSFLKVSFNSLFIFLHSSSNHFSSPPSFTDFTSFHCICSFNYFFNLTSPLHFFYLLYFALHNFMSSSRHLATIFSHFPHILLLSLLSKYTLLADGLTLLTLLPPCILIFPFFFSFIVI